MEKELLPESKAAVEIELILKRHNVAGLVIIQGDTHAEFATHFPTWSIAQLEWVDGKRVFKIRGPNVQSLRPEDRGKLDEQVQVTMDMLLGMQNICARQAVAVGSIIKSIAKAFGVKGGGLFMSPKPKRAGPEKQSH